jgi:hypothetical protein
VEVRGGWARVRVHGSRVCGWLACAWVRAVWGVWVAVHLLDCIRHHASRGVRAASGWPSAAVDSRRERDDDVRVAEHERARHRVTDRRPHTV